MRVLAGLLVWLVVGTAAAAPKKKPAEPTLTDQMATWRKQEGAAYDQFLDVVAQAKKRLDAKPGEAGEVAGSLHQFIDTMSLQLNVGLRSGMLRATDKIPTKSGALTGPQMLKELARIKRQVSDLAVKAGDKAAVVERISVLERSYDWLQRLPASLAGFEKAGRLRSALATATSGVAEAARFAKVAAETQKLGGGVTTATQLKVQKRTVPLSTALAEVEKLGRQAAKERTRLAPLAAAEQKRADEAHRAARVATAPQGGGRKQPAATPAAGAPAWQEPAVSSPLQTEEGEAPVEASPEPAAEEAPAASAAPQEQPAPRCNPTGATCGNANPPDDPCCAGSSCVDRFQYSDGQQGIGHCS